MKQFKQDFPFLKNQNLIYLDSAATTPKLRHVINSLHHFYQYQTAPVHRGIYRQAEKTTELFEQTRALLTDFFHAAKPNEIVFTSGTTESLNTIAFGFVQHQINAGDEIIISELEHNANVLPWQQIAKKSGAVLRYIPLLPSGNLDYDTFEKMLSGKTKFVSITHCSNSLGTIVNIEHIIEKVHEVNALVCVDAAQTAGHIPINLKKINADFFVCSAHKMYGPYGVGILYVKEKLHEQFSPFRFGGGIISQITPYDASFLPVPTRLEAGTPAIGEVIAFAESIRYLSTHFTEIQTQEQAIFNYLEKRLKENSSIIILGTAPKLHTVSFLLKDYHAHDIAAYLDQHNVAVRAGTHCAHLVASLFRYTSSVRASIGMYTTKEDIDYFVSVLSKMKLT